MSRVHPEQVHHHKSLNFGFSVDFQTSQFQSPVSCVNEMRHHLLTDNEHVELTKLTPSAGTADLAVEALAKELKEVSPLQSRPVSSASQKPSGASSRPASQPPSRPPSHRQSFTPDPSYDTFENCLHIADQMDALLSFHYMEENNPSVVRVTEIFALTDPHSPKPSFDISDFRIG